MGFESTVKQFVDGLLTNSSRHVLCVNIEDPMFDAARCIWDYLEQKNVAGRALHQEPSPAALKEALEMIAGRNLLASWADLDKHPKCVDLIGQHVKVKDPGGKLIVVSRHWSVDNTEPERQLRKSCMFYQQKFAPAETAPKRRR